MFACTCIHSASNMQVFIARGFQTSCTFSARSRNMTCHSCGDVLGALLPPLKAQVQHMGLELAGVFSETDLFLLIRIGLVTTDFKAIVC